MKNLIIKVPDNCKMVSFTFISESDVIGKNAIIVTAGAVKDLEKNTLVVNDLWDTTYFVKRRKK